MLVDSIVAQAEVPKAGIRNPAQEGRSRTRRTRAWLLGPESGGNWGPDTGELGPGERGVA